MSYDNEFVNCCLRESNFYLNVKKAHPTEDEFNGLLKHINNFYTACEMTNKKVGMIINAKELGLIDYKYADSFSSYFKKNEDIVKNCIIATSIICDNVVICNLVNAFLKIYKSIKPVKVLQTIEKGVDFINGINYKK